MSKCSKQEIVVHIMFMMLTSGMFVGIPFISQMYNDKTIVSIKELNKSMFYGDMKDNRINNVALPLNNSDAVNKLYVDTEISKMHPLGQQNGTDTGITKMYIDDKIEELIFRGNMENKRIVNLSAPVNLTDAATKKYVDERQPLNITNGNLDMKGKRIFNVATPQIDLDVSNKLYVDDEISKITFVGDMQNDKIVNLGDPTDPNDAVNKKYIDDDRLLILNTKFLFDTSQVIPMFNFTIYRFLNIEYVLNPNNSFVAKVPVSEWMMTSPVVTRDFFINTTYDTFSISLHYEENLNKISSALVKRNSANLTIFTEVTGSTLDYIFKIYGLKY